MSDNKRLRLTLDSVADEYLCPITLELPYDPVMAEDGNVYERSAAERHISETSSSGRGELRSPVTQRRMGPRLVPSRQARNAIEKLVRSGVINGEKARLWTEREGEGRFVEDLRVKSESGDEEAMYRLAICHYSGQRGVKQDSAIAYSWWIRSSDLGHVKSMGMAGYMLVEGIGTEPCKSYGMALLGTAAGMGSETAAFFLGLWHHGGEYGLPEIECRARYWLQRVSNNQCEHKHMSPFFPDKATEILNAMDETYVNEP